MTGKRYGALLALSLSAAAFTVAAQTCNTYVTAAAPNNRYVDPGDGTVTDTRTGLMWKKCSESLTWNSANSSCAGTIQGFTWEGALSRASNVNVGSAGEKLGHNDWRLPSVKELASLVERKCFNPAVNMTFLLNTEPSYYWSSSPLVSGTSNAWVVDFNAGIINDGDKTFVYFVRLVRGGQ